jgi:hypothetical protein
MLILNVYVFYRLGLVIKEVLRVQCFYFPVDIRLKLKSTVICGMEGRFGKKVTYSESAHQDLQNNTHCNNF